MMNWIGIVNSNNHRWNQTYRVQVGPTSTHIIQSFRAERTQAYKVKTRSDNNFTDYKFTIHRSGSQTKWTRRRLQRDMKAR